MVLPGPTPLPFHQFQAVTARIARAKSSDVRQPKTRTDKPMSRPEAAHV